MSLVFNFIHNFCRIKALFYTTDQYYIFKYFSFRYRVYRPEYMLHAALQNTKLEVISSSASDIG